MERSFRYKYIKQNDNSKIKNYSLLIRVSNQMQSAAYRRVENENKPNGRSWFLQAGRRPEHQVSSPNPIDHLVSYHRKAVVQIIVDDVEQQEKSNM